MFSIKNIYNLAIDISFFSIVIVFIIIGYKELDNIYLGYFYGFSSFIVSLILYNIFLSIDHDDCLDENSELLERFINYKSKEIILYIVTMVVLMIVLLWFPSLKLISSAIFSVIVLFVSKLLQFIIYNKN